MLDRAPLLAVKDLQAWYGESHILHGVDFEVFPGEVVTLLGRNGAGKSSLLNLLYSVFCGLENYTEEAKVGTMVAPGTRCFSGHKLITPGERYVMFHAFDSMGILPGIDNPFPFFSSINWSSHQTASLVCSSK